VSSHSFASSSSSSSSSPSLSPSIAITQYIKKISESNRKTGVQYHSRLRQFADYFTQTYHYSIDELTISKIFTVDVYDLLSGYVSYLINKKGNSDHSYRVSNSTIKQNVVTAKNFLEAHDIEIFDRKFKLKVKIPKAVRRYKEALSKDTIVKILETCSNIRLKTYVLFLAATGCRASEGCAIRLCDLDLDKCKAYIRGDLSKTKTDRYVFLTDELVNQLRLWLDYKYRIRRKYLREEHKNIYFTPNKNDYDLVFASSFDGTPENFREEDIDHLYVTLLILFEKTMDTLKVGYEDISKRRRKITLHSMRRFVKSTISDLGFSDYSEWFIGHEGSTYYRRSEKEKLELFSKIEPYLTFLDQTTLERKGADIQTKLEERDKEIADIRSRFDLMQSQIQSLLSSLGTIKDQNQVNQIAQTLFKSRILKTSPSSKE
jgi:integrase